jgi:hypothetical protein
MKTHTAPWDYEKTKIVVSVNLRLCDICGNYVMDTPQGVRCLTCGNPNYVEVPDYLAETVRCGLWMAQYEKALYLAGLMPEIGGAMVLNWKGEE